jgi:hypothetical protein
MKKIFCLMVAMIFLLPSVIFAQKITPDKVPAPVKQSFMKEFPKTTEESWKMDNGIYQVFFMMNGEKHAAKFNTDGQWVDKEKRIKLTDLPKEVTVAMEKNFAGFKAYEAEQAETPRGIFYNVGLEKEKEYLEVHFTPKGDVLSKLKKDTKSEWGKDND